MESRQYLRAQDRRMRKARLYSNTVLRAQEGGPSRARIHRNRRHRGDQYDYFK